MKKIPLLLFIVCILSFTASCKQRFDGIHEGDLIFQTSLSAQSQAIQLATKSRYSHCGILFREHGRWFVFEAVQPVKKTPLEQWTARGKDKKFVIKRLRNADRVLTEPVRTRMRKEAKVFIGKDYDRGFAWSDDRMYCSELIWKIYERGAGIEIGKLQRLQDFDLSHPVVSKKMKQRYGAKIPLRELVVSPASIFEGKLLETVLQD